MHSSSAWVAIFTWLIARIMFQRSCTQKKRLQKNEANHISTVLLLQAVSIHISKKKSNALDDSLAQPLIAVHKTINAFGALK